MFWKWAFMMLFFICTVESSYDNNNCFYKNICSQTERKAFDRGIDMQNATGEGCNPANIPEHELVLVDPNEGTLEVTLDLLNFTCNYTITLVVHSTAENQEECEKHLFDDSPKYYDEIHSVDEFCLVNDEVDEEIENNATCKGDSIKMNYQYIFTGCYALRFHVSGYDNVYRGKKYIETNYRRTDIEEQDFICTYYDKEVNNSSNAVAFNLEIGVPSDSLGFLAYIYEKKGNREKVCRDGYEIITNLSIKLRNLERQTKSPEDCKSIRSSESLTEQVRCGLTLPVNANNDYCLKIVLIDRRCLRETLWKPPPKEEGYPSCTWTTDCKLGKEIDYKGKIETRIVSADSTTLLPITVAIILLILIISGVIMSVHRWRIHSQQVYLNANLRELRMTNHVERDVIDTDDELRKKQGKMEGDEGEAIVLLYAKGSTSFMAFMSEFRQILKHYCKCHVFDWYSACEWNAVAKVGACDWATNLFKKNNRAVWIDTPTARLLACRGSDNNKLNDEDIKDFRDMALSAVLDYAKRSVSDIKQQYSRHFIVRFLHDTCIKAQIRQFYLSCPFCPTVPYYILHIYRLEGFDNGNSAEDPFSDLSPHARYLIPYHLSQLCSHLSSRKSDSHGHALMTEEAQLRERLIQIKNDT